MTQPRPSLRSRNPPRLRKRQKNNNKLQQQLLPLKKLLTLLQLQLLKLR
jgi:hypothetical protein